MLLVGGYISPAFNQRGEKHVCFTSLGAERRRWRFGRTGTTPSSGSDLCRLLFSTNPSSAKKGQVHREMLSNLRRGDRIVTNGGLIGTITRVPNETELILEVADGVKVRVLKGHDCRKHEQRGSRFD